MVYNLTRKGIQFTAVVHWNRERDKIYKLYFPWWDMECLDVDINATEIVECKVKTNVSKSYRHAGSRSPKIRFSFNPNHRKGLILEYGRERPADQCQIVRRVEMWYTSKDIGPFSTCSFTYQLQNEVWIWNLSFGIFSSLLSHKWD